MHQFSFDSSLSRSASSWILWIIWKYVLNKVMDDHNLFWSYFELSCSRVACSNLRTRQPARRASWIFPWFEQRAAQLLDTRAHTATGKNIWILSGHNITFNVQKLSRSWLKSWKSWADTSRQLTIWMIWATGSSNAWYLSWACLKSEKYSVGTSRRLPIYLIWITPSSDSAH